MKPATLKDTSILAKLPVGKWFAAGSIGAVHPSQIARLHRLGWLQRRPVHDPKLSRTWDYLRPR
jgi:hypothetical protein